MASPKYLEREQFAKGADLGEPGSVVLLKGGGIDLEERACREIVGKDALFDFLVKDSAPEDLIEKALDEHVDDELSFPFVLSTSAPDRSNDVITQSGWALDNYRRNPIVLFGHDHCSLPVARASAVYVSGNKLKAIDRFSNDHELARTVGVLYAKGFLSAVSVGFAPKSFAWSEERGGSGADFFEQELLEHSAVPVPCHQDALIEARSMGLEIGPMIKWAEQCLASNGGLFLPKALIEGAIAKTSTRFIVDLGAERKSEPVLAEIEPALEVAPVEPAVVVEEPVLEVAPVEPVVEENDLAKALEIVKAAGLSVCSPELFEQLRAAPVAPVVEAPKPDLSIDKEFVRNELRAAFKAAWLDPLGKLVVTTTGRLD